MWEQLKWVMVENTRIVCSSVQVRGGNPKNVWWNNQVKTVVKRKEVAWKEVLGARDKDAREKFGSLQ